MSEQPHWTLNLNSLTSTYNEAKDLVISALIKDGLLSKTDGNKWASNNAIIIAKNSWLGELWEKCHGKDDPNKYKIHVITKTEGKENESGDRNGSGTANSGTGGLARFEIDEKV